MPRMRVLEPGLGLGLLAHGKSDTGFLLCALATVSLGLFSGLVSPFSSVHGLWLGFHMAYTRSKQDLFCIMVISAFVVVCLYLWVAIRGVDYAQQDFQGQTVKHSSVACAKTFEADSHFQTATSYT